MDLCGQVIEALESRAKSAPCAERSEFLFRAILAHGCRYAGCPATCPAVSKQFRSLPGKLRLAWCRVSLNLAVTRQPIRECSCLSVQSMLLIPWMQAGPIAWSKRFEDGR